MFGFLRWITGLVIAIALAVFSVLNRQTVEFYLYPFQDPYEIPLFAVLLPAMAVSFFMGALFIWISHFGLFMENRRKKKDIKKLEEALDQAAAGSGNPNHSKAQENVPSGAPLPPPR